MHPIDLDLTAQRALLLCGLVASLLKVGSDILAGMLWKGYSFTTQSISELSAIGSPTRPVVLCFDFAYDVLMIAFGIGLWHLADKSLLFRIAAGLVIANPAISLVVSLFLPMRIGEKPASIHVVLMATAMFCFLLAMIFGGAAYRNWFRFLSFGILLAYIVLAVVRILVPTPAVAGHAATTIGAQERTMVLGYLLWIAVLAIQSYTRSTG